MAANEGHVIYLCSMGATKPLPGMRRALPADGFGLAGRGRSRAGCTGREHSTGRGEHSTPRQGAAGGGEGLLRPHPAQGSAAPLPQPSQQGKGSLDPGTKQTQRGCKRAHSCWGGQRGSCSAPRPTSPILHPGAPQAPPPCPHLGCALHKGRPSTLHRHRLAAPRARCPGADAGAKSLAPAQERASSLQGTGKGKTVSAAVPGEANALLNLQAEPPALKGQRQREMEVA